MFTNMSDDRLLKSFNSIPVFAVNDGKHHALHVQPRFGKHSRCSRFGRSAVPAASGKTRGPSGRARENAAAGKRGNAPRRHGLNARRTGCPDCPNLRAKW